MSNVPPNQQQGLPDPIHFIKPEQVSKLPHLTDNQKSTFTQGITKLWQQFNNFPEGNPDRIAAHKKLAEVSNNLKVNMKKWQVEQAQQHNGARPVSQGQSTQQDGRPQTSAQPPAQERFSETIMRALRSQSFIVPPGITAQGQEASKQWVREAQHKYALYFQKYEAATVKLNELSKLASSRQAQGTHFSPEEAAKLNAHKHQYQRSQQEAKEFLNRFKTQQDGLKLHQNQVGNAGVNISQNSNIQAQNPDHSHGGDAGPQQTQTQMPSEHQRQPHTVSSALDAARNQAGSTGRSAMSPVNPGHPQGLPATSQGPSSQNGITQNQPQNSHIPHLNINTGTGQPHPSHNSPQVINPQPAAPSQGPHPLSHKAAVDQSARQYQQPNNYQQSTPQSSTHAHPQIGNRDPPTNNNAKMPIPKDLKIPLPQPVAMGPARPTLTGGPSNGAQGSMGQPAIQKHPGYVLEGEGERVLSKKKLQELVRQVTGGGGGEGEEEEGLTAEVEEVLPELSLNGHISSTKKNIRLSSRSPMIS